MNEIQLNAAKISVQGDGYAFHIPKSYIDNEILDREGIYQLLIKKTGNKKKSLKKIVLSENDQMGLFYNLGILSKKPDLNHIKRRYLESGIKVMC